MKELPKAYEAKNYEDAIYKRWEESGFFNPDTCVEKNVTRKDAAPFSIVLPPPNVTGTLHMGHAAMLAIEDVMVRYHRMKGDRTLWVPGTDHAAVATESKVEAKLIKEEGFKKPKQELGRDKFLERVEQFAKDSHDTIVNQCKKMGASLDWSREAYTLDEQRSLAVRTVFKKMYEDGLIYRGYRVINWSVKGQSTCSDDELVHIERPAKLYYFKYAKDFPITIATTRPETKLGDSAVAVNPKDKRYKKFIGKTFTVDVGALKPLAIKIIADENIEIDFGTGALGVTPAHSQIDFAMYEKQKAAGDPIELIQVIGEDGKMTEATGKDYVGLTVEEAREKFVAYLREQNLLQKEEDITQNVGTSDRFGDVVEALPKTQWFVDVQKKVKNDFSKKEISLKEMMQEVVRNKDITIVPDRFEKTYFNWIDNLRDWCISRQIWFGHRIPVWILSWGTKTENGEDVWSEQEVGQQLSEWLQETKIADDVLVKIDPQDPHTMYLVTTSQKADDCLLEFVETLNKADQKADEAYGAKYQSGPALLQMVVSLEQDPDTLDTWFSSGLWTFSTLGWPDEDKWNKEKIFHPTSVLETGYDILFFWVARMILMTTYTLGAVPFKTVYLHGLVRDEKGRKMSKSLGNIINPLDMIEKYGTDATRLSLLLGNTPGNDMKLSEEKIVGFRNFTNKLWNIARFMLQKIDNPQIDIKKPIAKTISDHWILWYLDKLVFYTNKRLSKYEFSYAGELLRAFTWNELADWYLEIAKREGEKSEILNYILNSLLKLWHPYMPYVTETIWYEMYSNTSILMVQKFPEIDSLGEPNENVLIFENILKPIISAIHSFREENKVEVGHKINIFITTSSQFELINNNKNMIADPRIKIANLMIEQKIDDLKNKYLIWERVGIKVYTDYSPDSDKEKTRLTKELEEAQKYLTTLNKKLSNNEFVKNAPEAVVNVEKEKLRLQQEKVEKLKAQLASL
jgi:valyl-tRNA synthetase